MQTESASVSHNKIVVLIVFLCAAIMTSVFVFHAAQKPVKAAISPDVGIIFPVARDIKSFKLLTANREAFTQQNFLNHWTLVFFGFTHCSNVCPTTLDMISRAYPALLKQHPNLQVTLISLDPERDTPQTLAKYTQSYRPQFIGVTGKIQEIHKLQSQLGVYSAREEVAGNDYQLQHTSSIMLVNPKGQWVGLFKFGLKPEQFARAFEESVAIGSLAHA